jgi:hypothetical protein
VLMISTRTKNASRYRPFVSDFWADNNHGNALWGVSLRRDPS